MHELDDQILLTKIIESLKKQLGVDDIHQIASGNEFCILRADLISGATVIKIPRDKIFSNVNDAYIDSKVLLDQELSLIRHVKAEGIRHVPDPIGAIQVEGFRALLMSFVPSDDSKPDEFELGKLLANIHAIEIPNIELRAQEKNEIPELIANRLHRRWKELRLFVEDLPQLPARNSIVASLEPTRPIKNVLHMDFRQANFRLKDGQVIALLDWSNALIGHPALELARVAETGETGQAFLDGYKSARDLPITSPLIETIFRLDTATMLALVFLSEEPDPARGLVAVSRVSELYQKLKIEMDNTH